MLDKLFAQIPDSVLQYASVADTHRWWTQWGLCKFPSCLWEQQHTHTSVMKSQLTRLVINLFPIQRLRQTLVCCGSLGWCVCALLLWLKVSGEGGFREHDENKLPKFKMLSSHHIKAVFHVSHLPSSVPCCVF